MKTWLALALFTMTTVPPASQETAPDGERENKVDIMTVIDGSEFDRHRQRQRELEAISERTDAFREAIQEHLDPEAPLVAVTTPVPPREDSPERRRLKYRIENIDAPPARFYCRNTLFMGEQRLSDADAKFNIVIDEGAGAADYPLPFSLAYYEEVDGQVYSHFYHYDVRLETVTDPEVHAKSTLELTGRPLRNYRFPSSQRRPLGGRNIYRSKEGGIVRTYLSTESIDRSTGDGEELVHNTDDATIDGNLTVEVYDTPIIFLDPQVHLHEFEHGEVYLAHLTTDIHEGLSGVYYCDLMGTDL